MNQFRVECEWVLDPAWEHTHSPQLLQLKTMSDIQHAVKLLSGQPCLLRLFPARALHAAAAHLCVCACTCTLKAVTAKCPCGHSLLRSPSWLKQGPGTRSTSCFKNTSARKIQAQTSARVHLESIILAASETMRNRKHRSSGARKHPGGKTWCTSHKGARARTHSHTNHRRRKNNISGCADW